MEVDSDVRKTKLCLYVSHGLSTFGERAWDFMTGLILLQLDRNSLRLVASLGLSEAVAGVVLGPLIGHYIDRNADRYRVACQFYLLQNIGILCACVMAVLGLQSGEQAKLAFAIGMIGFSVCGRLGMSGATISVERDWTKALFQNNPQGLAQLNSGMKAIDLTSLLVAPILSGALMTYVGSYAGAVFLGIYNAIVWIIEVMALRIAISIIPSLRLKLQQHTENKNEMQIEMNEISSDKSMQLEFSEHSRLVQNESGKNLEDGCTNKNSKNQDNQSIGTEQFSQVDIDTQEKKNFAVPNSSQLVPHSGSSTDDLTQHESQVLDDENDIDELNDQLPLFGENNQQKSEGGNDVSKSSNGLLGKFSNFSVSIYFSQFVWPAGLALAMLYLTVMSFGILMTSYLKYRGIDEFPLSLWRGAGAISGVISTFSFPRLHRIWGLKITALVGLASQVICLWIGLLLDSLIHMSSDRRLHFLVAGLVGSRWGLYTFDAGVMQMLQDWVLNQQLGRVNGVQKGLQNLFELTSFLLTLVISDPSKFDVLMWGSVVNVSVALLVYLFWVTRQMAKK